MKYIEWASRLFGIVGVIALMWGGAVTQEAKAQTTRTVVPCESVQELGISLEDGSVVLVNVCHSGGCPVATLCRPLPKPNIGIPGWICCF